MSKSESSIDVIKVYIGGMVALTVITFIWLVVNIYLLGQYREKAEESRDELKQLYESEQKLVNILQKPKKQNQEIKSEINFFRNKVCNLPRLPQVRVESWSKQSENGKEFEEKRYVITFDSISRKDLARYVYMAKKLKEFLGFREIEMEKAENSRVFEDRWKAKVTFSQRRAARKRRDN